MIEDDLDEKSYAALLLAGGEQTLAVAARGFSLFGFKKNQNIITSISAGALDYSKEGTFAALRCAHSSRHLTAFMSGRETWLPLLHTSSLFRFYAARASGQEAKGGSLTSSQLYFELVEAFNREMWSRATAIAVEMADRGEYETLLSALRSEAVRRQSITSNAYTVWNAVRCSAHYDTEILREAAVTVIASLAEHDVSGSYAAARRRMNSEKLDSEKLAESEEPPDEREKNQITEALRSGIPEVADQLLARALKRGVSPQHLLQIVAVETLNQSFNSSEKLRFDNQVESISAIIESNSMQYGESIFTVPELLVAGLDTASLSSQIGYRRKAEKTVKIGEASELLEKGRPSEMIAHIESSRNNQELEKASTLIALASLGCDPEVVNDHPFVHCASSMFIGGYNPSEDSWKTALRDCAAYVAAWRKERGKCRDEIMKIIGRKKHE